jgi:hypothetical protein
MSLETWRKSAAARQTRIADKRLTVARGGSPTSKTIDKIE